MISIMIGLSKCIIKKNDKIQIIYDNNFKSKNKFDIVHPSFDNIKKCIFIDYCSEIFNNIRITYNILTINFLNSLGPESIKNIFECDLNTMISISSSGKSGSFFFYSSDYKYLVKTITKREKDLQLYILKNYYNYIFKNNETLINKIIGLYKLKYIKNNGKIKKIYLTISQNIFITKPNIIYDLKGSLYNREYKDETKAINNNIPLKDLNFLNRGEKIYLDELDANNLITLIKNDIIFLTENKIIDYSLLLGIEINNNIKIETTPKNKHKDNNTISNIFNHVINVNKKKRLNKIYQSPDGKYKYHIGIIDTLTYFNTKKLLEYKFKYLLIDKNISCVPPNDYSIRFINFIKNSICIVKN